MNPAFDRERSLAIQAVRKAAVLCRAVRTEMAPDVLSKSDRSPVTVADFGSQAVVAAALAARFPDDPLIAEEDSTELRRPENERLRALVVRQVQAILPGAVEQQVCDWIDRGASHGARRFWTLDPIDGTKGFLRNEQYAVALALIVDHQVAVAALACPNLPPEPGRDDRPAGCLFVAARGEGAFQLPLDGDETDAGTPIHVSAHADPAAARFCESVESGHSAHDDAASIARRLGMTRPPLRLDSQAKYAVVARGEADIYLRLPTRADYVEKLWDHAAGLLIVNEAGGRVTDIHGHSLDLSHGRELSANRGVIATNGKLHDRVLCDVVVRPLA